MINDFGEGEGAVLCVMGHLFSSLSYPTVCFQWLKVTTDESSFVIVVILIQFSILEFNYIFFSMCSN